MRVHGWPLGRADHYALLSSLAPGTGTWETITMDEASYVMDVDAGMAFDKTKTATLAIHVQAGKTASVWANPTVIYIDQITDSAGVIGPYTFDSATSPDTESFHLGQGTPFGTSLTWLGP